jgi:hypothetical protein
MMKMKKMKKAGSLEGVQRDDDEDAGGSCSTVEDLLLAKYN